MSFYNMMFGKNPQSALLLAVIGLCEHDVPRFRDVSLGERAGKPVIELYTRMGGGNRGHWDGYDGDGGEDCACPGCRADYGLRSVPGFLYDEDDDFDNTYATYYFAVPSEFERDVLKLSDVLGNGIRKKFGQHLLKTLRRDPTDADKEHDARESERNALSRTRHFMANGHTFVPKDDAAMKVALELAEANGGTLRTCWGILPIAIIVKTNERPWPNAKDPDEATAIRRVVVDYDFRWSIDEEYWLHCQQRWATKFPLTMAKIGEAVERQRARSAA